MRTILIVGGKLVKLMTVGLGFSLVIAGCKLDDKKDQSSTEGVVMRSVEMSCSVTDAVGCSSSNDGGTVRVNVVDDCASFQPGDVVYASAEGILDCDLIGCNLASTLTSADFSPSAVAAGTYDLYAFIDEDNDDLPDTLTEPIGCLPDVELNGSTSDVTITIWD